MRPKTILLRATAAVLVLAMLATACGAQSVDALLDKLQQKGILTAKEVQELRDEAKNEPAQTSQFKNALPDWVTSLKFNGDFRGRYDGIYIDNPAGVDRNRFFYRLRFGAVATLEDQFELGLRLASGDTANGGSGANPISANATLQDNASRKPIYIERADAKWTPLDRDDWRVTFTGGKMENPFAFSSMVFDRDYYPEGAAEQVAYAFNDRHAAKLVFGQFVLDELSTDGNDPFLLGAQLRLDSKWSKRVESSVGVGGLLIAGSANLVNSAVPNQNRGNTRTPDGALVNHFNPIVVDGSVTYFVEGFPLFRGPFPIKLAAEYMNNPAADAKNYGYNAEVTFGKAGKKGTWELAYRWVYLGADAWYEELVESESGGFYQVQQTGAGFATASNPTGAGYGAGTNTKGHLIRASYAPLDSLLLSVTYYRISLINSSPPGSNSDTSRLQFDAMWRF